MAFLVQPQVAGLLRAMGGVLDARSALEQMLHVAAEGDVSKLRMLVQSGIPIDKGPHPYKTVTSRYKTVTARF